MGRNESVEKALELATARIRRFNDESIALIAVALPVIRGQDTEAAAVMLQQITDECWKLGFAAGMDSMERFFLAEKATVQ